MIFYPQKQLFIENFFYIKFYGLRRVIIYATSIDYSLASEIYRWNGYHPGEDNICTKHLQPMLDVCKTINVEATMDSCMHYSDGFHKMTMIMHADISA